MVCKLFVMTYFYLHSHLINLKSMKKTCLLCFPGDYCHVNCA